MSVSEAVEVLKACGAYCREQYEGGAEHPPIDSIRAALSTLEGIHLHASRFLTGQFVFVLHGGNSGAWRVYPNECKILRSAFTAKGHVTHQFDNNGIQGWRSEDDCFQFKADAEQAAARRNQKG